MCVCALVDENKIKMCVIKYYEQTPVAAKNFSFIVTMKKENITPILVVIAKGDGKIDISLILFFTL